MTNSRDKEILKKAAEYRHPIPKEPISTLPEILEIIKNISEKKSDLRIEDCNEMLISAIHNEHEEIVAALLNAKIDPNTQDDSETPLHAAAYKGNTKILKMLLDAKAEINVLNKPGNTPLFNSIITGFNDLPKKPAIQLLLDAKADPNLYKEDSHFTPLYYSFHRHSVDTVMLLLKAGAKPRNQRTMPDLDDFVLNYAPAHGDELKEGITRKELNEALTAIHWMLSHGASFDFHDDLYQCIRTCNQRNPLVEDSLKRVCEYLEKLTDAPSQRLLNEIQTYLKKLRVVLEYKPLKEPVLFPTWDEVGKQDMIAYSRAFSHKFDAKEVEKLYVEICQQRHPFLSLFGILPVVSPQVENDKMDLSFIP